MINGKMKKVSPSIDELLKEDPSPVLLLLKLK